jgi:uncharacterized OB-fold protein
MAAAAAARTDVSVSLILPAVDELSRPFWDGCADGELRLQRCDRCGELRYPIATICPVCLSTDATWERVSGRGRVFSFAVFHQVYNPAWADRVPYVVAIVQLDEGPRLISNVVQAPPEDVRVDAPVDVVFETEDGVAIPRFRLMATPG